MAGWLSTQVKNANIPKEYLMTKASDPAEPRKSASDYSTAYRAKRIAEGWKQVNFLLSPDQAKKLSDIQDQTGMSVAQIVGQLIMSAPLAQP